MTDQDLTIGDVVGELAQLRARVEAQDTELAELRSQPVARRHLLRGLAGLGAAGMVGVAAAQPAGADDGDNLILGQENASTTNTSLTHTSMGEFGVFGVTISSDGHAALAVGGEDIPGYDPAFIRYGLWADMQSERLGDTAIKADAKNGFAVEGRNTSVGLPAVAGTNQGTGPGIGGMSEGGGPQLYLETSAFDDGPVGPPTTGLQAIGGLRLDVNGDLWVCVADGEPGTWTRYLREDQASGRTIPITPIRALDTRATGGRPAGSPAVPGQKKGPLAGGTPLTLDLAGVSPIPATAHGVVGNLTVTSPTQAGYLTAAPSGSSTTTSALNFTKNATVANAFTCQLGPDGLTLTAFGVAAMTHHLIVDITAYIT